MKRRDFVTLLGTGGSLFSAGLFLAAPYDLLAGQRPGLKKGRDLHADLVIAGGGLGGCACALAALRNGLSVIMTEQTGWIGGQLTQQGVPPDEHRWIESYGATRSYRDFRNALRNYYRHNYPLTGQARSRQFLNPGDGVVSRLCTEPRAAVAVLLDMLAPYIGSGRLTLLTGYQAEQAWMTGDKVHAIEVKRLCSGDRITLTSPYFADATELGDLLPLTGTEYVTGTEAQKDTSELHAPETADPANQQAFTLCFAMDYLPGEDHTLDKPEQYDHWRAYIPSLTPAWPGPLLSLSCPTPAAPGVARTLAFDPTGAPTNGVLNLWNYRRIINRQNFSDGFYRGDITIVNWPQNDYMEGHLIDVSREDFNRHLENARQLNLSLLYWLQTEAPRPDGGMGWPGLRFRPDIMGTENGMAQYPYIRESRRIKAAFTILEEHIGGENRLLTAGPQEGKKAAPFFDSIGVGSYYLDLHPTTGGNNYIDLPSLPFQIPMGALLPQRLGNLLPACKNIGTTHITNGCYRLHPVEWNIGEVVGLLVCFSLQRKVLPREVREKPHLSAEFQKLLQKEGIPTHWS